MAFQIKHTDKIASGLLLLLMAAVFVFTQDFPTGTTETSPAFFPRVIVALIGLFAVVQLVRAITNDGAKTHEVSSSVVTMVAVAAALVVGYVALIPVLGFLLATILFLVVSMHFSGVEKVWRSVPVSIGVTLVLYYVFVEFLRVPLPENPFVSIARMLPSLWVAGGGIV